MDNLSLDRLLRFFVVEYSVTSNAFHVHSVRVMLRKHLETIAMGYPSDFVPVFFCESREEADRFKLEAGIKIAEESQYFGANFERISKVIESLALDFVIRRSSEAK